MLSSVKVLVVDDDAEVRDYVLGIIGADFETRCASSVQSALQVIDDFRPNFVLTDLRMPGGDGSELLNVLVQEHPGVLVALMTGFGNAQTAIKAFKGGVFDFLEKPFSKTDLTSLMENVVQVASFEEAMEKNLTKNNTDKLEILVKDTSFEISRNIGQHLNHIKLCTDIMGLELQSNKINIDLCLKASRVINEQRSLIEKKLSNFNIPKHDRKELISIESVAMDAVAVVERKIADQDVCLIVDIEDSLDVVLGQRHRLTKMVVEVMEQALAAAQNSCDRWIILSVESLGEFVEIKVFDSREYNTISYNKCDRLTIEPPVFWSNYVQIISETHGGKVYSENLEAVTGVVIKIQTSMTKELIFAS